MKTRKDKRKPFTGAKAVDKQCRNNGKCAFCKGNRTYANTKREQASKNPLLVGTATKEWLNSFDYQFIA